MKRADTIVLFWTFFLVKELNTYTRVVNSKKYREHVQLKDFDFDSQYTKIYYVNKARKFLDIFLWICNITNQHFNDLFWCEGYYITLVNEYK